MGTLDARTFWKQFKKEICAPNARYINASKEEMSYRDAYINGNYTNLINKYIVPNILKNNCLNDSNEYYRFDVTGWKDAAPNETLKEQFGKAKLNYHAWTLEVSFEHENNSHDWSDEVIKLLYANCPLKIVVGYNDSLKRDHKILGDNHKLELLTEVIKNLNVDITGEYLIIIGNGNKKGYIDKEGEEYFGYRAYLYNKNKNAFEELKLK